MCSGLRTLRQGSAGSAAPMAAGLLLAVTWIPCSVAIARTNATFDYNNTPSGDPFESAFESLAELQGKLREQQKRNEEERAYQLLAYKVQLDKQKQSIRDMQASNVKLTQTISDLKHTNADLRSKASNTRQKVNDLRAKWVAVRENITMVKEVVGDMLRHTGKLGPHIEVLRRLDVEESQRNAARFRQHLLHEIEERGRERGGEQGALALLQTGSAAGKPPSGGVAGGLPDGILQTLHSSFVQLKANHEADMLKLRDEFKAMYNRGELEVQSVMAEHQSLNDTVVALLGRKAELDNALIQLSRAHEYLTVRDAALRRFFGQLAAGDSPGHEPSSRGSLVARMPARGAAALRRGRKSRTMLTGGKSKKSHHTHGVRRRAALQTRDEPRAALA